MSEKKKGRHVVFSFAIISIFAFLFHLFVVRITFVYGPSMEPTVYNRAIVLVSPLIHPKLDDVVLLREENEIGVPIVKRIVATAGQTVEIKEGTLFVDDIPTRKTVKNEILPPFTVPPGEMFILGDNPAESIDSRIFGCVTEKSVVGVIFFILYKGNSSS